MDVVLYLAPLVGLFVAGYWTVLLWRYPDRPPQGLDGLPIGWTRTRWRAVAMIGIVAGLGTALITYLMSSS